MRLLWTILITCGVGMAAGTRPDPAGHIDRYLSGWAGLERFSGNVLLAKNGKIVFQKSYGSADIEHDVANRPDTVFRIGSITKSFTGLAVLQLEERGLLKVEEPLTKYLPETPGEWKAVTLHHLLTHTSGVPDISKAPPYSNHSDPLRIDKTLKEMAGKPLDFEPGSRFTYSNSGYMILGRVIEKVSGKKYEEYLTANILRPAGMNHSGLDHNEPVVKHRASGYVVRSGALANAVREEMMGPFSAGGLYSTAGDLLKFDRALRGEAILKKATLDKAFTPRVKAAFPPPFNDPNAHYGYGWLVSNVAGHRSIGHGGWVSGFVTDFTRYPDDDMVLIVLGNIEGPQMPVISQKVNRVLWGGAYEVPKRRPGVRVDPVVLDAIAGKYEVAPGMVLTFTVEDGRMFVEQQGQAMKFELRAESESSFFVVDLPTTVTFDRDTAGKVVSALLDMDGQKAPARKMD
jgi:CubicO group peptidase (beta-lactamase class C family)